MPDYEVEVYLDSPEADFAYAGPQGLKGDKGDQGNKGDKGDQGEQGIQGVQGDQGIQGLKGDKGDIGNTGAQGIQGVKGDTGAQGIQGIQGNTGLQGIQGIQGIQGVKGDPGDQAPASTGTLTSAMAIPASYLISTRVRTLTANLTISFQAPDPASTISGTFTLVLKQAASGTGPFTVTWPSLTTLPWAGGAAAPTMPTVANSELIVSLFWTGVAWRAVVVGVFFP